jgi:hypothetical protein
MRLVQRKAAAPGDPIQNDPQEAVVYPGNAADENIQYMIETYALRVVALTTLGNGHVLVIFEEALPEYTR